MVIVSHLGFWWTISSNIVNSNNPPSLGNDAVIPNQGRCVFVYGMVPVMETCETGPKVEMVPESDLFVSSILSETSIE